MTTPRQPIPKMSHFPLEALALVALIGNEKALLELEQVKLSQPGVSNEHESIRKQIEQHTRNIQMRKGELKQAHPLFYSKTYPYLAVLSQNLDSPCFLYKKKRVFKVYYTDKQAYGILDKNPGLKKKMKDFLAPVSYQILPLKNGRATNDEVLVVTGPYYSRGNLLEYSNTLNEYGRIKLAKRFYEFILKWIALLESKGLAFTDLKPQQILVDDQGNFKFMDLKTLIKKNSLAPSSIPLCSSVYAPSSSYKEAKGDLMNLNSHQIAVTLWEMVTQQCAEPSGPNKSGDPIFNFDEKVFKNSRCSPIRELIENLSGCKIKQDGQSEEEWEKAKTEHRATFLRKDMTVPLIKYDLEKYQHYLITKVIAQPRKGWASLDFKEQIKRWSDKKPDNLNSNERQVQRELKECNEYIKTLDNNILSSKQKLSRVCNSLEGGTSCIPGSKKKAWLDYIYTALNKYTNNFFHKISGRYEITKLDYFTEQNVEVKGLNHSFGFFVVEKIQKRIEQTKVLEQPKP